MGKGIEFSFSVAVIVFIASYLILNLTYCQWAVWRYPQHNSMAGLSAMIYGLPVGAVFAVLGFVITFYRAGRRN